jgi:hypothetical protein
MTNWITTTVSKTWQADIYIGRCIGYSDSEYDADLLKSVIAHFQKTHHTEFCGVTVTELEYIVGDFRERGFKISVIQYPRFPKEEIFLEQWTMDLASHLLLKLQQNRLSVVYPNDTYLLTAPDAQDHPPKD